MKKICLMLCLLLTLTAITLPVFATEADPNTNDTTVQTPGKNTPDGGEQDDVIVDDDKDDTKVEDEKKGEDTKDDEKKGDKKTMFFKPGNFMKMLPKMGVGMVVIFAIISVIILTTMFINKLFSKKD